MTKSVKNDYFENGKPVHQISYCAFLDVLGFNARISQSFKQNKGNELLQEFHSILTKSIKMIESDAEDSLLYFKSFTDNIILAHPRFTQDMEDEFAFILWTLSVYQFEMALHGFFIRGGLSIGDLFVDENSAYGPALLEAYNLESKIAVNPIVVLSEEVMGLVLHHCNFYDVTSAPQNRDVLVNADGRFFINYLTECFVDTGLSEEVAWDALDLHKKQIEKALNDNRHLPEVFAKFSWLAAYHNYFCHGVSTYSGYNANLKVSDDLASIQFKRLSDIQL